MPAAARTIPVSCISYIVVTFKLFTFGISHFEYIKNCSLSEG